ncbi:MAG: hypothetical protein ACP5QT_05005 [Brevinematia bacterium]
MKITYRIIKYSLISIVLLIIVGGMVVNTFNYEEKDLNPYLRLTSSILSNIEKWFLKDDYKENIILKIEKYKNEFDNLISERVSKFASLKKNNEFLESIFVYFVSKNPEKLNEFFSKFPEFKDVIIIDRKNNLIYKKSDVAYQLSWLNFNEEIEITNINNDVILLQNYSDKSFDVDLQIAAILDSEELKTFLKTSSFPASYVVGSKVIKNDRFPESWLKGLNLLESQKVYKGMYNIAVFPLLDKGSYYGSLVMLYPVRDFGSILILLLKVLLFLIVILSLYELDRFLEGKISKINVTHKQRLQMKRLKKASNLSDKSDLEYEKSLDWVGKYIEKTEGKK